MKSSKDKSKAIHSAPADLPPQSDLRHRILSAASDLLSAGGADAITTRAVAEAAGVQSPALYRFFADKTALLDALTEFAFEACVASKPATPSSTDPVENMRHGWDDYVSFGLTNPALFRLMYAGTQSGTGAVGMAHAGVQKQMLDVAKSGRLSLDERRAANLIHAAASGMVLFLLGMPEQERDMSLSAIARDAAIASITSQAPVAQDTEIATLAIALRARLDKTDALTTMELGLMTEWLDRISHTGHK